jgi:serine/threonine protein kinase/tetratricopeptide (TPR) repeat protein
MAGEVQDHRNELVNEAAQQYAQAYLKGQAPDLDTFLRQFPGLEKEVRSKIESFQKVDSLFGDLRHIDESELTTADNLVDKTVGHFRITEVIGHGGMGVVYKAYDSRLDRVVAIKTVPAHLLEDRAIQERFRREAQILAALNHPHIAVIYDILEQADGCTYLILEYVPGQTLAERIRDGPLPVRESLSVGLQVAESLVAAYEKGIVHRDLKPGNIKITPEGKVKVLDFGIAKTFTRAPAVGVGLAQEGAPTETATQPGRLIGTPAYMSPEQARGRPTDHRADIWSFGCVMYEMLTGKVAFEGGTVSDTIARVIERDPDWDSLPSEVPGNIRVLLQRCLQKDARDRLQHIGDAVIEIRETLNLPAAAPSGTTPSVSLTPHIAVKAGSRRIAMVIGAAIIVVMAGIAVWLVNRKPALPLSKEIRLVVLPFENLGSAEDEYFAAGITDAITARLATIHGLAVISRQSAMQYKKREKTAQQIADELRVDYILEGTVQRERPSDPKSRVRIIPQLIKASTDAHVWAEPYDNDMNEVFRVQSDLAERVAQALNIALVERERRALRSRPTENMEAYDCFLRGNEYYHRSRAENDWKIAIQMFERAVELDPKFALAYAQLSRCHAQMYWEHYTHHTSERLEMAKRAVDRALQLEPDLPEAHLALGHYYYRGHLDYDRALEQFAIARKDLPNDSDLLSSMYYVQNRQGKFEEALANLKRAFVLDPRSNILASDLRVTLAWMRNYPEAMRCCDRAISLAPDLPGPYGFKAELYLRWEGDIEKARAVVEEALKNISSPEEFQMGWQATFAVYEGDYQKVLDRLSLNSGDTDSMYSFVPTATKYARVYAYMNESESAKKYYDEARSILETKIQQEPDDSRFRSALGIAYAGLGRRDDAIREGMKAVELLPVTKEAIRGYYRRKDLARIYVMVGDFDLAIDQIEYLLSIPGDLSKPLLRLDPAWAPLREHPRFKKLLGTTK